MKGMTAHYLLHRTYAVQPGDAILVHVAAGGMGLILCQWVWALEATATGTVSTEAKAQAVADAGGDYPIVRSEGNFAERVHEITDGEGVAVVHKSIGRNTV